MKKLYLILLGLVLFSSSVYAVGGSVGSIAQFFELPTDAYVIPGANGAGTTRDLGATGDRLPNGFFDNIDSTTSTLGAISLSGDLDVSSAAPTINFLDTDAAAGDDNARILTQCTDVGDGTEDCDVTLSQQIAGALTAFLTSDADGDITLARDLTLGNDLFLPTGSVTNWAAGDFTLTQTNDVLTLSGGRLIVQTSDVDQSIAMQIIQNSATAIPNNIARNLDIRATGAMTGAAGNETSSMAIRDSFTLTDPGGGTMTYNGANITVGGIAVTAGVGDTVMNALNVTGNTDSDLLTSRAADITGEVEILIDDTIWPSALDLNWTYAGYTDAVGVVDIIRSGAITGAAATDTIADIWIAPTFALTESAANETTYEGIHVELSGMTVVGAGGTSALSAGFFQDAGAAAADNRAIDVVVSAIGRVYIDATTTIHTDTRGVIDVDLRSSTASAGGLNVAATLSADPGAGNGIFGVMASANSGGFLDTAGGLVAGFSGSITGNAGDAAAGILTGFVASNNDNSGSATKIGYLVDSTFSNAGNVAFRALSGTIDFVDYAATIQELNSAGAASGLAITTAAGVTSGAGGDVVYTLGAGAGGLAQGVFRMGGANDDVRWKMQGTGLFRVEDSASTDALTFDHNGTNAIIDSTAGDIDLQPAASSGVRITPASGISGIPSPVFRFDNASNTGLTAATEYNEVYFSLAGAQTWVAGAGPLATQRTIRIDAPTYNGNAAGALTITDAATLYIGGAPIQGTNIVLSNTYALWVDGGALRLDGDLFVNDTAGVVIGNTAQITASSAYELQVLGTGAEDTSMLLGSFSDTAFGSSVAFTKSRSGTIGTSTIVQDNDVLGSIVAYPADGSTFNTQSAEFRMEVDDATPAVTDVGTAFAWLSMPGGGGAIRETMRLAANGTLAVINNVTIGNGAAGVDYTLTFDGETNDGVLTWSEDEDYFSATDSVLFSGNAIENQGTDIASASTIAIPTNGNTFELTGTTSVNLITTTGFQNGFRITLIANESVVINTGNPTVGADAGLVLDGGANYSMTARDTLTLVLGSTTAAGQLWFEVSRSVN